MSIIEGSLLQLGSSGGLSKKFHRVGIGPLSKILAVKVLTMRMALILPHFSDW